MTTSSDDWRQRLCGDLEPVLRLDDPRPKISAYHDMPYAVFLYPPRDEWALRQEVSKLETRLKNEGKGVHRVSLADCLTAALEATGYSWEEFAEAEAGVGVEAAYQTLHMILGEEQRLDDLVAERIPQGLRPERDVVFILRAGALFPFYRTSSLLEQLKGKVSVPSVLFYPGERDGAAGLRFMGVLEAEHNYRPKIF